MLILGPNTVCNVIETGDNGNNVAHNVHTFVLKATNIDEVFSVCGNLRNKLSANLVEYVTVKLYWRCDVLALYNDESNAFDSV